MRSYHLLCVAAFATWPGVSSAADDLRRVPEKYLPLPGVYRFEEARSSGQQEWERSQGDYWKDREYHLEKTKTGYLFRSMHKGKLVFQMRITPDKKCYYHDEKAFNRGVYCGAIKNLFWTEDKITSRIKSIWIHHCYVGEVKLTYEGSLPKKIHKAARSQPLPTSIKPIPTLKTASSTPLKVERTISLSKTHSVKRRGSTHRPAHVIAGDTLFVLEKTGVVRVDLPTGKLEKFELPSKPHQICVSGNYLVCSSTPGPRDWQLIILDRNSGKIHGRIKVREDDVELIGSLGEGRIFAVDGGHRVSEFDVEKCRRTRIVKGIEGGSITDASYDARSKQLVVVSYYSGNVAVVDTVDWKIVRQNESDWFYHVSAANGVAYAIGQDGLTHIDTKSLEMKVVTKTSSVTRHQLFRTTNDSTLMRDNVGRVTLIANKSLTSRFKMPKPAAAGGLVGVWKNRLVIVANRKIHVTSPMDTK